MSGTSLSPAEAFSRLAPTVPDYATAPIMAGFNWSWASAQLPPGEWYLVVFRSVRRPDADELLLEMHDFGAYIEAERRGNGLLMYYRGIPNERCECLSFCIWTDRDEALRAAKLPLHHQATRMVAEWYESFRLERYRLYKRAADAPLEAELLGATENEPEPRTDGLTHSGPSLPPACPLRG